MKERRQFIREEFKKHYGRLPSLWARAPGRVDLMGSHTDYNTGFVMTMYVCDTYQEETNIRPEVYAVQAVPGAMILD